MDKKKLEEVTELIKKNAYSWAEAEKLVLTIPSLLAEIERLTPRKKTRFELINEFYSVVGQLLYPELNRTTLHVIIVAPDTKIVHQPKNDEYAMSDIYLKKIKINISLGYDEKNNILAIDQHVVFEDGDESPFKSQK